MLVAVLNPHSRFSISLQNADFEFTTSEDGDEKGQIVFPSITARSVVSAHVGEDVRVYCTNLSKTVWRGQVERIEETEDGSVGWNILGFGALQRDARVSIAREIDDIKRWKPVGRGFLTGNVNSRLDFWEIEQIASNSIPQIQITTKRTFTINNSTLAFVAFLFHQPERYTKASSQNNIFVNVHAITGLATGVRVAPIVEIPQPPDYLLICGAFTNVTTNQTITTTSSVYGWVVGVNASGNETVVGATSVRFSVTINKDLSLDSTVLSDDFIRNGGSCIIALPEFTYVRIEKSDANLRDVIEKIDPNRSMVRYYQKRFFRDTTPTIIDFHSDSPFTWRFRNKKQIVDISKTPDKIYAEYEGYWTEHLTQTTIVPTFTSYRNSALAHRLKSAGKYQNEGDAEIYRDIMAETIETNVVPITIDLDNNTYELMTRTGICVPNWSADVGDYAEIDNYFKRGKIVARTITRDRTTYDVTFHSDDFISIIQ